MLSTTNSRLNQWVEEMALLCEPTKIHLCDGSQAEYDQLASEMVLTGTFTPLNPLKRPHSFLCRSTTDDVARLEERTFICSLKESDAGPTNNWRDPKEMRELLLKFFRGSMRGRTLYVIPYSMGP